MTTDTRFGVSGFKMLAVEFLQMFFLDTDLEELYRQTVCPDLMDSAPSASLQCLVHASIQGMREGRNVTSLYSKEKETYKTCQKTEI